jgi:hypothetical protein
MSVTSAPTLNCEHLSNVGDVGTLNWLVKAIPLLLIAISMRFGSKNNQMRSEAM